MTEHRDGSSVQHPALHLALEGDEQVQRAINCQPFKQVLVICASPPSGWPTTETQQSRRCTHTSGSISGARVMGGGAGAAGSARRSAVGRSAVGLFAVGLCAVVRATGISESTVARGWLI